MIKLKDIITEGVKEDLAVEYLKNLIAGSEFENKVLVAGGAVRDELMGMPIKDIDLVVDLPDGGIAFADWATQKMGNYKEGSNPVTFPVYGTAKFNLRGVNYKGQDLSDIDIETVAPRSEEYEPGSRKPKVKGASLKADAERRDLTANSLFKNITTGEIIDLTGKGREDLEKGIARTPLDPDVTFRDDALRMMRLIRFYVKYNWTIPLDIVRSLKRNASEIVNISMERVQDELNKILKTDNAGKAMKLVYQSGLAQHIFPNIHFTQDKIRMIQKARSVPVKLAILFHDLKKSEIEVVMRGLKYPTDASMMVANSVALQSFFDRDEDIKTIRKFRRVASKYASTTLDLIDALDKPVDVPFIRQKLTGMKDTPLKSPLNGGDLIALGMTPGPDMKKVLDLAQDKFEENPEVTKDELINMVRKML